MKYTKLLSFNRFGRVLASTALITCLWPYAVQAGSPAVTTLSASGIGTSSATINGTVNPNGATASAYFQYGLTSSYGNSTLTASNLTGTGAISLQSTLTGLNSGTTYHYRLLAYNVDGQWGFGSDGTFTTATATPTLTLTAPNGGETWTAGTTHSINWTVSGSTANIWYYKVALSTDGGATWPVTGTANDLTPDGIMNANARSFSWTISSSLNTSQARIRVQAIDFSQYIIATARDNSDGNFTISPAGVIPTAPSNLAADPGATSVSLAWSDNSNNETGFKIERKTGSGGTWSQIGTTGQSIASYQDSAITAGATYYYRVRSYNVSGNSGYSGEVSATIPASVQKPTVFTASGQSSGSSSAMLWGNVTPNGAPTDAWFEWGNTAAYGNTTPVTAKGSGIDSVQHLVTIDGLSYSTTYHFRVVARNSAGTSYGTDKSFTMPAPPVQLPSVLTLAASDVSRTWASLQGIVNPNGSPCSIWFQWGTTTGYGNRTTGQSYGGTASSDLSISEMLTGLAEGQTYHFRACASNSVGIVYGSDTSFQTEAGTQLTVNSPNGGESVLAGTSLSIGWTVGGNTSSINNFRVDYSLTAGAQWSSLAYCQASARAVTWNIPSATATTQARIRVRACDATGNILNSDESDSNFTINSGSARIEAIPTANYIAPNSGVPVTFDGSASRASSGNSIVSYSWKFGDGATASGPIAQHSFTASGTTVFTNWLTVTDSSSASASNRLIITVTGQAFGEKKLSTESQDPVNLATGNFIYDHTDLVLPGIGFPFEFKRSYNSQDLRFTGVPLGCRWTHSYNIRLNTSNGCVNIVFGDGHSETYTNSAGTYLAEPGIYNTLTTNAAGNYILITKEQMRYNFDALSRLASIVDKNSNTLSLAYDGAGALTVVTNSAGRVITFINDASHRITAIIDPLNRTNSFVYSEQGDLISATDPRGGVTRYGYDAEHQMTNSVDPNGNEFVRNVYNNNRVVEAQRDVFGSLTTFTYDFVTRITVVSNALGDKAIHKHDDKLRVVEITDEAGNTQNFEYDDSNNRTKVVDKNRRTTSYTYDAKGNVTSKIDPLLNPTTIAYDALNNPTSRVDALLGRTTFTYDTKGNLIAAINPLGYTNSITYEPRGLPQIIRDANGNAVSNTYDSAGNLIATLDAMNYVRGYSYDAAGRKVYEVNPNNATNRFVYDPNNNLIAAIDPLGVTNAFVYDANNNQVLTRDALGFETVKIFDAKDRLIAVSNALSGVSSNVYDVLDRKIATVDSLGNTTRFAYDPVGNLVAVTNALNQATHFTYDANGNQLATINALGQVTTNKYDELNRLVSVTDPLGNTTRYDYDELGRRIKITDANLQVTRFQYDALGQLTNVIDAANGTVSFAYDRVGNRTAMKEPNGHITASTYDVLNRLIEKQEPIGTYKYSYDGAGNRVETVDALSQTNSYVYDANNRLLGIVYPAGAPVTFAYDANGNRISMTDTLGTTTYRHDALNRLTNCTDSAGMTVGYSYDIRGNRESMTYPNDKVVSYTFDALNRMTSVCDWLGGVTTNTYDVAGNLVRVVNPNGTTARYGFDDSGRVTSLTNALSDSTVIASYTLTLDGVGNHRASAQIEPLEPVISAQAVNYAYDQDNRLTNATGSAFAYDLNGNMTAKGADTFIYDYENRLTSAVVSGTNYLYQYDGIGNRLRATRGGITTKYVLDVNGSLSYVLAEADGNGTIAAYYVYGRGLVSRITAGNVASYYHYDVRGSTVALSDSTGTITDKYAYDPFGVLANGTGTSVNPFKYVGRYGIMDEGNSLAYIRARYYSPTLGRFVTKDPVTGKDGDSQSLNRYIYALNNPLRLIDVSGFSARESSSAAASMGTSDIGHSRLLDETRRARVARMLRIQQYQTEALYWEQESIYWNATADVLQGANDALDTAMSLFTGSVGGVISGLTKQTTTLLSVLGFDTAAQRVSKANDILKIGLAFKGINDIAHAGSSLVAGLGAQGQNMVKDSGLRALFLPEDNPIAESYKTLALPFLDIGLDSLKGWASGDN